MKDNTKREILKYLVFFVAIILAICLSLFTTTKFNLGEGVSTLLDLLLGGVAGWIAALINTKIDHHYFVKEFL